MTHKAMVCVMDIAVRDSLSPILSMCAEHIVMLLHHYIPVFI